MQDLDVLTQGSQNTIEGKISCESYISKNTGLGAGSFVSQMKDQEVSVRVVNELRCYVSELLRQKSD